MGKQVLGRLLLGGGLIVGLTCSAGQAEVIKRIYPDGTIRYAVVHGVPSAAETAARLPPPRPEDIAATKEAVRIGTPPPITSQREEDGRLRITVPTIAPLVRGSCGIASIPRTREEATTAYETVLGNLQANPDSVECRLQLVRIGRQRGESELAISNDLRVLGVPSLERAP
jgi:hypothetical protein